MMPAPEVRIPEAFARSAEFAALSEAFAKAYAVYTLEILSALRGASDAGDAGPVGDEGLDAMPDWVREEHARTSEAGPSARMVSTNPDELLATVIRNRLLAALHDRGLTQSELARRLGKSESVVSRILHSPTRCRFQTLQALAGALNTDVSDLVSGAAEPSRKSSRGAA